MCLDIALCHSFALLARDHGERMGDLRSCHGFAFLSVLPCDSSGLGIEEFKQRRHQDRFSGAI